MNKIYVVIGLLLIVNPVFTQAPQENGAFGGGQGIFVFLGNEPVSNDKPVNGIAYYQLERKAPNDANWTIISKISGPGNEKDFTLRLNHAIQSMPYDVSFLGKYSANIWNLYIKYHRLDSLKSWITYLPVQIALGILYYDQTAKTSQIYQYQVVQVDNNGNPQKTITFNPTSFPGKNNSKGTMTYLRYAPLTAQVTVFWKSNTNRTPAFSKVYRQNHNGGEWIPLNVRINRFIIKDTAMVSVVDTSVTNGSVYRYKLIPLDYYGNPGIEALTGDVAVYNFNLQAPVIEHIEAGSSKDQPGIRISWSLSRYDILNSVKIYRSDNYDKGYKQIAELEPTSAQYIDQQVIPNTKYYYYIRLTGPLGEITQPGTRVFAISDDLLAPLAPKIIEAAGIPDGIQLRIAVGESEIKGIRIFRSDKPKGDLVQVSGLIPVKEPIFTWKDTTRYLQPGIFYGYAVKAENFSNVQSLFSDTLYALSGKTLKPSKVNGLSGKYSENYIQLYWTDMQKIDVNITGYMLYRKELPNGNEIRVNDSILDIEHNWYTDRKIEPGKSYSYTVEAVNDFGNVSGKCDPVQILTPVSEVPVITGLVAFSGELGVKLSWNTLEYGDLNEFKLFRYIRGSKPQQIGTVPADQSPEYIDKTVQKGQLYYYYVVVVASGNREGKPSSEIGVRK